MKKIPSYLQIIIGLFLGILWGVLSKSMNFPSSLSINYLKPFGDIFVNLLKMIAVPLVFASLIVGISQLNDVKKLSRIGGKTIILYIMTTFFALCIGLSVVNIIQPGKFISTETREMLLSKSGNQTTSKLASVKDVKTKGPLAPLVEMIPTNFIKSAGNNTGMLQVVVFAILLGIAAISIAREKAQAFISFFDSFNEVIIKLIDFIMLLAPIGVFALIGSLIASMEDLELLVAVGMYMLTVITGLIIMVGFYITLLLILGKGEFVSRFLSKIYPAQLLAFSSSSSSATLPVTIKQCEEIGVSEEVSSFVLPLGATINMDGTSLYQAVATVFIAQVIGKDLSFAEQLVIIFTALLASIGSAGVPGAGMVMLAIVLEAVNIPVAYIALIIAPDRILDMCRTVINVTGDATVASIVAKTENQLIKKE